MILMAISVLMQKITIRNLTTFSLLLTIGIILHFVEFYISIPIGGFVLKPGVSNIVILICLYYFGIKETILLAVSRILLSALFEPSINSMTIAISFGGVVLSLTAIILLFCYSRFNIKIISVIGAILHNIGQLIVVLFFIPCNYLLYYLPLIVVSGFFGGYITGWIAEVSLQKIDSINT